MAKEKEIKIKNVDFINKAIGRNYADVIIDVIKVSPSKGMTIGKMRELTKELDGLEDVRGNTEIEVSESSFKHIIDTLPLIPFQIYSKELIDMIDYLESLDTTKKE